MDTRNKENAPRRQRSDARREQILKATREACLDTGFSNLTISDITKRANMTRSLFYHYFKSKDDVADALLESAVNSILARLQRWNDEREEGDINQALEDLVRVFRDILADEGPLSAQLMRTGNAELYLRFIDSTVSRIADYICETAAKDFDRLHGMPISNVHESFYILVVGMISLLRKYPETSDEVIKQVAAQTLHLDEYVQ